MSGLLLIRKLNYLCKMYFGTINALFLGQIIYHQIYENAMVPFVSIIIILKLKYPNYLLLSDYHIL